MTTLVWAMCRMWRCIFPPYRDYWRYVDAGWFHENSRLKLVEEIHYQPYLRGDMQGRLLATYERLRDECWAKADQLMWTPDRSEL